MIRLEDVLEKHTKDQRYFIELEILDKTDNKTWRIAENVVQKYMSGDLCYLTQSPWQSDVTVYVIITVKNQGVWVRHFIDNIVDIQDATDDQHIHPIIVDFGSRDSDTDTYLKRSRLKHYSGKQLPISAGEFRRQYSLRGQLGNFVSLTCSKSANIKLHQLSMICTDVMQLDEVNRLDTIATCWQLASDR